ncbi:MAG: Smr/MutS family protein [Bacteroidota bacterium]
MSDKYAFNIGDHVAVIDDTIKGKVIEVNKDQILIQTKEGFNYRCRPDELILSGNLDLHLKNDHFLEFLDKNEDSKPKKKIVKKVSLKKQIPPMEVDLHIHHLTKTTKGMSNYDMLTLQLKTAEQQLKFAISKKIQRVVFIHGIGEGVLKEELDFLFQKYPVKYYEASFQKYGQGATEVYIYQNFK